MEVYLVQKPLFQETLNVTKELVKRGYTQKEIEKIWGGNLLRVMEQVEALASDLQKIK